MCTPYRTRAHVHTLTPAPFQTPAQTYAVWAFHEREPGVYTFSGRANLTEFVQLAQELGLMVQLRLGPYIAGEWTNGGIPPWLARRGLRHQYKWMQPRSDDPFFLAQVEAWYRALLPVVEPLLWRNGGPVVAVQM